MRIRTLSRRAVMVAVAALLAALLIPAVALGASAPVDRLSALTLLGANGTPILIISAQVPEGAKMPATIELPVPKDAKIIWSGEVLGGDMNNDPERQTRIEQRDGHSVAVMTLEKGRVGQIEVELPKASGSEVTSLSASLYVPEGVKSADAAVRVPAGAKITTSLEGLTKREGGPNGTVEYASHQEPAKAGSTLSVDVAYESPLGTVANPNVVAAPQAGATQPAASSDAVLYIVLAVVAIAAFFIVRGVTRRMREKNGAVETSRPEPAAAKQPAKAEARPSKPESAASSKSADTPKRKISPAMIIVGVAIVAIVGAVALAYEPPKKVVGGEMNEVDGVQVVSIDTSTGDFAPGEWTVKAGKPIKLVLGSGSSCSSRITFPQLGIDRDLTNGAEIDIPALEPGRYPFNCSSGSESGAMIVE